MALIDMVGFDRSDTVGHYFVQSSGTGGTIATGGGRFSTKGFYFNAANPFGDTPAIRNIPGGANYTELYISFALMRGTCDLVSFFSLLDGVTRQLSFTFDSTGKIYARRGIWSGTSIGDSGAYLMPLSTTTFHSCEMHVVINNTTGSVELKIDGVTRINVSSQDTVAGSNVQVNAWGTGGGQNTNTYGIDDMHLADTTGSVNNTWLGDRRIITLRPNASGDDAGGTSSTSGSSLFSTIDETGTPNGDTDYNLMATSGLKDTFNLEASGLTTATVHGVKVSAYARKTDVAACTLDVIAKSGSTEMQSSATALGTTYAWVEGAIEEDNNAGPAAWTVSDLDSLKAGYTRTA